MLENTSKIITCIDELLLSKECVVIPGLGGFIVRDSPCNFNADKSQIKPANRNLFFNPHLNQNDGLLFNALQNQLKLSYSDAQESIKDFVNHFNDMINSDQSFKFGRLGVFYNGQNNVWFSPANDLNLSLDSYGLDALDIQTVHAIETPTKQTNTAIDNAPIMLLDSHKPRLKPWLIAASVALLCHVGYLFFEQMPMINSASYQHQASVIPNIQAPIITSPAVIDSTEHTATVEPITEAIPVETIDDEPMSQASLEMSDVPSDIHSTKHVTTQDVKPLRNISVQTQILAKYKIKTNADFHLQDLIKKGVQAELIFKDGYYQIQLP